MNKLKAAKINNKCASGELVFIRDDWEMYFDRQSF